MGHAEDKKKLARRRYVFERQSMPTIALLISVSETTIRRWKKAAKDAGDDWDVARSAHMIAGQGLEAVVSAVVEDVVILTQSTIDAIKADEQIGAESKVKLITSLADSMNKMVAAAGRAAPKVSELGVAQDVLKRLAGFIREHHPKHAEAFLEVLEPFGEHLIEVYS